MELGQEQFQEILEWVGFKQGIIVDTDEPCWLNPDNILVSPADNETGLPLRDMNTIVQWIIPKLGDYNLHSSLERTAHCASVYTGGFGGWFMDKDLVEAFLQATYKALKKRGVIKEE